MTFLGEDKMTLEIEQLIKIIIGLVVVVVVVVGVYLIFKNQILDFFRGFSAGNITKSFLSILK
jgi:uncharacterized membrane protein